MNKKNKIIIILSILAVLMLGIVLISNHNKGNGIKTSSDSEISQNADDNEETVKNRIKVYHEQTEPIKEYYEKQGKLVVAYGQEELEDTTKEVAKALGLDQ